MITAYNTPENLDLLCYENQEYIVDFSVPEPKSLEEEEKEKEKEKVKEREKELEKNKRKGNSSTKSFKQEYN